MSVQAHALNAYSAKGAAIEGGWGTLWGPGAWVTRGGPLKLLLVTGFCSSSGYIDSYFFTTMACVPPLRFPCWSGLTHSKTVGQDKSSLL